MGNEGNKKNVKGVKEKHFVAEKSGNTTIFDDVFRTMLDKMPQVVIPVINEVFNTSYNDDEEITHYKNEHITKNGKIITDSCIGIQDRIYHLECQSTVDSVMILRMIEYDFGIALNNAHKNGEFYEMEFPKSCVLYLRHNSKTPEELMLKVKLPDGNIFDYKVPTVKVQKYTKDQIFQKKLLMFLPFYIMRYEKEFDSIAKEPKKLEALINEYEDIRNKLGAMCEESEKSVLYNDLILMIVKISDYMLAKSKMLKERIGETMAGRVLKLFSEEQEELKRDKEELEKNKEQFEKNKEELEKNKEQFEKNKEELEKNKEQFEKNKEELEKNKEELEKNKEVLERDKEEIEKEREKIENEKAELKQKQIQIENQENFNKLEPYVKLINENMIELHKVLEILSIDEEEFMMMINEVGLSIRK